MDPTHTIKPATCTKLASSLGIQYIQILFDNARITQVDAFVSLVTPYVEKSNRKIRQVRAFWPDISVGRRGQRQQHC